MSDVAAIVLAAGAASRYGSPKQLVLLPEVLERLVSAGLEEIVVVAGAHELPGAATVSRAGVEVRVVACPQWRAGPGASLRCGLAALGGGCRAAIVVLADGPDLDPAAIERVLAAWRAEGGDVLAASYGGVRGHPLLVARAAWGDVPDEGLRLRAPRLVPCDDLRHPGDVDTPDDLPERLRA